jgi:hypothetical protein
MGGIKIETHDLQNRTLGQKLFGGQQKINALYELRNLIAQSGIGSLSPQRVGELEHKYKVSFTKHLKEERVALFKEVLTVFLEDDDLSESEVADLSRLKSLLQLSDSEAAGIRDDAVKSRYGEVIKTAIEDGELSDAEKSKLKNMRERLSISDETAQQLYQVSASARVERFIAGAISDARLSPEEDAELKRLSEGLSVELEMDRATAKTLELYRTYWQIENGDVPTIDVDIRIQKSEQCYFSSPATWLELRKVTTRVNYGGPTMRIKIVKGIYWRAGSVGVQRVSEDVMKPIDTGTFYLTTKRIVFMGEKGNKTIQLNKILDFEVFSNGVQIEKETGRSPFLEFSTGSELFALLLGRALRDL